MFEIYQFRSPLQCQKSTPTQLPTGTKSTYAIAFSPCGTYVATTTGDHCVHILETISGKHVKTLSGHPRTCWSVVFHPNNPNLIASGDLSGEVRVWGRDGGKEIWRRGGTEGLVKYFYQKTSHVLHRYIYQIESFVIFLFFRRFLNPF